MVLAVYLPAIQSRVPGENRKKALVFKDSNMRWQLKTQGSSQVFPPVSVLGQRPKPLGRENQGWQWNPSLATGWGDPQRGTACCPGLQTQCLHWPCGGSMPGSLGWVGWEGQAQPRPSSWYGNCHSLPDLRELGSTSLGNHSLFPPTGN